LWGAGLRGSGGLSVQLFAKGRSAGTTLAASKAALLAIKTRDDTRRELHRYLLDNKVDEGRADEMADDFSLALTVPMVALDRLQAAGMVRKHRRAWTSTGPSRMPLSLCQPISRRAESLSC
jgi:hypothetical protein